jgi:hypothetical protein
VGAASQVLHSSGVVSKTGMAFGWTGPTTPLASQVRNENSRWSSSARSGFSTLVPRTPVQGRQIPAKANNGRSSFRANQVGVFFGLVAASETGSSRRHTAKRAEAWVASAIRWHERFRQNGQITPNPGDRTTGSALMRSLH